MLHGQRQPADHQVAPAPGHLRLVAAARPRRAAPPAAAGPAPASCAPARCRWRSSRPAAAATPTCRSSAASTSRSSAARSTLTLSSWQSAAQVSSMSPTGCRTTAQDRVGGHHVARAAGTCTAPVSGASTWYAVSRSPVRHVDVGAVPDLADRERAEPHPIADEVEPPAASGDDPQRVVEQLPAERRGPRRGRWYAGWPKRGACRSVP